MITNKAISFDTYEGFVSQYARGAGCTHYRIGKWSYAPEWLARNGYHLLSYKGRAGAFSTRVLVTEAVGQIEELPPISMLKPVSLGALEKTAAAWPPRTVMHVALKPLFEVKNPVSVTQDELYDEYLYKAVRRVGKRLMSFFDNPYYKTVTYTDADGTPLVVELDNEYGATAFTGLPEARSFVIDNPKSGEDDLVEIWKAVGWNVKSDLPKRKDFPSFGWPQSTVMAHKIRLTERVA